MSLLDNLVNGCTFHQGCGAGARTIFWMNGAEKNWVPVPSTALLLNQSEKSRNRCEVNC